MSPFVLAPLLLALLAPAPAGAARWRWPVASHRVTAPFHFDRACALRPRCPAGHADRRHPGGAGRRGVRWARALRGRPARSRPRRVRALRPAGGDPPGPRVAQRRRRLPRPCGPGARRPPREWRDATGRARRAPPARLSRSCAAARSVAAAAGAARSRAARACTTHARPPPRDPPDSGGTGRACGRDVAARARRGLARSRPARNRHRRGDHAAEPNPPGSASLSS